MQGEIITPLYELPEQQPYTPSTPHEHVIREEHSLAEASADMPDLVQIRNPRTGGFTLLDRAAGAIVDHLAEARPGVPIAGTPVEIDEPSTRPMLAVLVWEDCRTSQEVQMDAPVRFRATSGLLDPDAIVAVAECTADDAPGTVVHLVTGEDYSLANDFEAFERAYRKATGVAVVEV